MKSWKFKSIETLILGFFLVRLYGIWFPPLETWHSWRQTLTNMMARNMSEEQFSFFYPTIDMAGERSGIIGSEFPLYQSIIASFNQIFGFEHWYGRLISLVVASIATWCFYKIIERFWTKRTAWYATLIFLTSLWFAFSRKTMPDTFAVSLVIIGIYWIVRFVDERNFWKLVLGGIFLTIGGLCKIPAVYLFALFIPFALNKAIFYKLKVQVGLTLTIASLIIAWWYFYWVPYLVETYRFQLFFPKGILEGIKEIQPYWSDFWMQLYFGALRSYIVWIGLLSGISWLFYKNNKRAAIGFGILTLVFLLFAIKTGTVFPTHNYYVLPFSPVLAALAGVGLQRFQPKLSLVLVLIIAIEGLGNQIADFRIKPEVKYRLDLAQQVNQLVPKGEKIIIATGPNPEWMYWYHREGWSIMPEQFTDKSYMNQIAKNKGKYIVIDKHDEFEVVGFEKVGETKDLKIYRFSSK
jgi:hypothetical protein